MSNLLEIKIDKSNTPLEPFMAMLFYKTEGVNQHYIETVSLANGRVYDPKPLERKTVDKIAKLTKNEQTNFLTSSGRIPSNILSMSGTEFVWQRDHSIEELSFKFTNKHMEGTASVPMLVFKYNLVQDRFKVFAVKGTKDDSKLYYAPFHNCYQDGRVCMGSVKRRKNITDVSLIIKSVENSFINSHFTHSNFHGVYNDLDAFWVKRLNTEDPFPNNYLQPNGSKLIDIL